MRARYLGVGKDRITDEKELLLSNMVIRRDIYLKANGFNEKLYPNEENELINRITDMGYRFVYNPGIKIYRDRRKTLFTFAKQFYRYGQGRMKQVFIEGFLANFLFFLPLFLLAYIFVLLYLKRSWINFTPLFLYIMLGVTDAIYTSFKNRRALLSFILPAVYITMHVSYSAGMLVSIYNHLFRRDNSTRWRDNCKIVYIKEFNKPFNK